MAGWRRPSHWPKVPYRLIEFAESDWGAEDGVPYLQWREARRLWCVEHGFNHPDAGHGSGLPDGPLGDVIFMINAERATRREWGP